MDFSDEVWKDITEEGNLFLIQTRAAAQKVKSTLSTTQVTYLMVNFVGKLGFIFKISKKHYT